jgi:hypothetical protein
VLTIFSILIVIKVIVVESFLEHFLPDFHSVNGEDYITEQR